MESKGSLIPQVSLNWNMLFLRFKRLLKMMQIGEDEESQFFKLKREIHLGEFIWRMCTFPVNEIWNVTISPPTAGLHPYKYMHSYPNTFTKLSLTTLTWVKSWDATTCLFGRSIGTDCSQIIPPGISNLNLSITQYNNYVKGNKKIRSGLC